MVPWNVDMYVCMYRYRKKADSAAIKDVFSNNTKVRMVRHNFGISKVI
jgi:hypothetical protein